MCAESQDAYVSAKEFLRVIIPRNSNAWVIMIEAYLDDTGAEWFAGFGGFAGKAEVWKELEPSWIARNEYHRIGEFHAKEYSELVGDYVAMILEYDLLLVGRTIDRMSYREYAPRVRRNDFGINIFADSARECVQRILNWMTLFPSEHCAFVIDCKSEYAASVVDAINFDIARNGQHQQVLSVTILNSENKHRFPMRQVADLGANLTARHTASIHYKQRVEKDFSRMFFERKHFLGITHADAYSIQGEVDIFTDPVWGNF